MAAYRLSEARRGRRLEDESLASPRGGNLSRSSSRRLEASVVNDRFSTQNLVRDVKAVADAQGRLVRVIEDVSQELSQRLAEHDRQLADHSVNQVSLRDALHKFQLEEVARHDSLAAEYLRLRTGDGDAAARLTFLESKVVGIDKVYASLNSKFAELEQAANALPARIQDVQVMHQKHLQDMYQKVLRNMEEQRAEFFQFQGQVSSRSHSDGLLSLQKQFEQRGKELASQLRQRLREQDGIIAEGQEALRQEAAKREQHLAELQDAAQRLAQTAMERAQASTEAHAHVFSTSSSLANRLAVVEGELQSAQRQEKERQQKRIARLEEDLAKSPMLSPRDKAGPNALDQSTNLLRALDELRVQIFAELSDARKHAQHLSTRISRCEAGVAELQQVTRSSNTLPAFLAQASPKHGASNSDSCPTTPDWPVAAWPGQGQAGEPASRSSKLCGLPQPDAGQTNGLGASAASQETLRRPSDSPTPSSPKATSTVHSKGSAGHGSALLGNLPEGPKLSHGSHGALQDSPGKSPQGSTRFGVLPPPKVTPSTPLPLQAE
ncbi:unnamed protein product [Symbiodinium sp. CCMP2456]|nr:unnamed protein product [Symbiodinium sp. CCMP2456]